MTRVLVVDDEPQILRALRINLQARHYDVLTATSGRAALRLARDAEPDLVVLDLGLPDIDGIHVVQSLRAWTAMPILILSGRLNSAAKVAALDAGADDYVTKPFNVDELLARVRAVTRRASDPETDQPVPVGEWLVDVKAHRVRRTSAEHAGQGAPTSPDSMATRPVSQAEEVHLTKTEWELLRVLLHHPGRLVSQRQLLDQVWGPGHGSAGHDTSHAAQTASLRQHIKTLRRKLEPDPVRPRHLLTEAGMGYRYQP